MPEPAVCLAESQGAEFGDRLKSMAENHPCSQHQLFAFLEANPLSNAQAAALLRNYDAHASVLRRLLLNAAARMPEHAVPFVLENVRNEYGNGDYSRNHQDQLRDLAWSCGISRDQFFACKIQPGISEFLKAATRFYSPSFKTRAKLVSAVIKDSERKKSGSAGCQTASELAPDSGSEEGRHTTETTAPVRTEARMKTAAIIAGAITATEILAIKEFAFIQKPFARRGLQHHIWFNHITIEEEHSDESLELARCFETSEEGVRGVEFGLIGVLDANVYLYDGLLAAAKLT